MKKQITLNEFIEKHRLYMPIRRRVPDNPNMTDKEWKADHWRVEIVSHTHARNLVTYYSMGKGHNGKPPRLSAVLDSLASDATGIESEPNFESWASSLGYDTDSRKAEATYRACAILVHELKAFLGDEVYKELIEGVESP